MSGSLLQLTACTNTNRVPISVVINPAGKHLGMVTIEYIVGEIIDEVEGQGAIATNTA